MEIRPVGRTDGHVANKRFLRLGERVWNFLRNLDLKERKEQESKENCIMRLRNFYYLLQIIWTFKYRNIGWAQYIARVNEQEAHQNFSYESYGRRWEDNIKIDLTKCSVWYVPTIYRHVSG
jgi:alcohol dehydrogenase YqhD (iron-dependent ADH family)